MANPGRKPDTVRQIFAKLEANSIRVGECRVWQGYTSRGYGKIRYLGKLVAIHRFVYTHTKGPIPGRLLVRHSCDNPPCWEPEHLILGTHKDNTADALSRNRLSRK